MSLSASGYCFVTRMAEDQRFWLLASDTPVVCKWDVATSRTRNLMENSVCAKMVRDVHPVGLKSCTSKDPKDNLDSVTLDLRNLQTRPLVRTNVKQ